MPKNHKQLSFPLKTWGGKRKGAGRKNRTGRLGHGPRARVAHSKPLHVTWRLRPGLVNLRTREVLSAFERSAKIAKRADFGIVHFSLQGNHLHLIIESKNNLSLAHGMRSLGCSFGKAIRRISSGRGAVFADRYHLHVLKTPTETKHSLIYVLQNRSRHTRLIYHLDEYSSAPYFNEWKKLLGGRVGSVLRDRSERELLLPDHLAPPRSWLAQQGWKNATDTK